MKTLAEYPSPNGPTWSVLFQDLDEELRFLRKMIIKYRGVPAIRNLAIKIIQDAGCVPRDKKDQSLSIGAWVQDNIYYVHELPERFQFPDETLRLKAGDCDDFTTLIGSMIESIGIPSAMIVMEVNGNWTHIFPAAQLTTGMLPLDGTLRFPVQSQVNPIEFAYAKGRRVRIKIA